MCALRTERYLMSTHDSWLAVTTPMLHCSATMLCRREDSICWSYRCGRLLRVRRLDLTPCCTSQTATIRHTFGLQRYSCSTPGWWHNQQPSSMSSTTYCKQPYANIFTSSVMLFRIHRERNAMAGTKPWQGVLSAGRQLLRLIRACHHICFIWSQQFYYTRRA